jgi:hypothetical protein
MLSGEDYRAEARMACHSGNDGVDSHTPLDSGHLFFDVTQHSLNLRPANLREHGSTFWCRTASVACAHERRAAKSDNLRNILCANMTFRATACYQQVLRLRTSDFLQSTHLRLARVWLHAPKTLKIAHKPRLPQPERHDLCIIILQRQLAAPQCCNLEAASQAAREWGDRKDHDMQSAWHPTAPRGGWW